MTESIDDAQFEPFRKKKRMTIWHYAENIKIGKRLSITLFARTSLLVLLNTKMGQLSIIFEKKQFCRFSFLSSTHAGGTTWSFSFLFFSMHEMNTEQLGRSYWRDVQCTSADSAAWQLRLLWTSRVRNLKPNIQESLPNWTNFKTNVDWLINKMVPRKKKKMVRY